MRYSVSVKTEKNLYRRDVEASDRRDAVAKVLHDIPHDDDFRHAQVEVVETPKAEK